MIRNIICLMLLVAAAPAALTTESRGAAVSRHNVSTQVGNSIIGSIHNQSRRPVENLRVELLDEVDGLIASTYTGAGGDTVL